MTQIQLRNPQNSIPVPRGAKWVTSSVYPFKHPTKTENQYSSRYTQYCSTSSLSLPTTIPINFSRPFEAYHHDLEWYLEDPTKQAVQNAMKQTICTATQQPNPPKISPKQPTKQHAHPSTRDAFTKTPLAQALIRSRSVPDGQVAPPSPPQRG